MCIAGGEWWYIYGENDKNNPIKANIHLRKIEINDEK